jgi:hypothetical protein
MQRRGAFGLQEEDKVTNRTTSGGLKLQLQHHVYRLYHPAAEEETRGQVFIVEFKVIIQE